MRRLLYVPIVHDEADLGSAGAALAQQSARLVGEGRWVRHQETLGRFWNQVATFLSTFDPHQLKVYQDGLPVEGEAARRIVEEAARRGSRNHRLILDLLNRGAELRRTEAPQLLWQERQRLLPLVAPSAGQEESSITGSPSSRERLMEERDKFIAESINATLKEGEVGVLFIGAHHEVAPQLAGDIVVEAAKDPHKVRAYFEALFLSGEDQRLAELAQYLSSAVGNDNQGGEPAP